MPPLESFIIAAWLRLKPAQQAVVLKLSRKFAPSATAESSDDATALLRQALQHGRYARLRLGIKIALLLTLGDSGFVSFLIIACLAAGLFGVLHDQLSYSVSPEYFTRFKFIQFRQTDPFLPERLRAALVGFCAAWWMGIPLAVLTAVAGCAYPTTAAMRRGWNRSLLLMTCFTFGCALAGLGFGYLQTTTLNLADYAGWYVPPHLTDPRAYLCVGTMHNASYIGGVLAIPLAWLYHVRAARRLRA